MVSVEAVIVVATALVDMGLTMEVGTHPLVVEMTMATLMLHWKTAS